MTIPMTVMTTIGFRIRNRLKHGPPPPSSSGSWPTWLMGALPHHPPVRSLSVQAQFFLRQLDPGHHVAQLGVGDLPGPGAQAAVRRDVDPVGVVEDVDRVEDA